MTDLKVFDLQAALQRVDNDKELLEELITLFFSDYSTTLESIHKAASASNLESVKESVHSMKSALGNLGAMKAWKAAEKLEMCAKNNDAHTLPTCIQELIAEVQNFKSASANLKS